MDLDLWWGDLDRRAVVSIGNVRRAPRTKDKPAEFNGNPVVILRTVDVAISGNSSHDFGQADINGVLRLRPNEVLQLFDALLTSSRARPNLRRAIRALISEVDFNE